MIGKTLMYTAILGIATTAVIGNPDNPAKNVKVKAAAVISSFIDAEVNGDAALLNFILDNTAQLKMNRREVVITQSKAELVDFAEKKGRLVLNCSADYEVLSFADCVVMVRVDFKFPEFVQQNYITIEKDKKENWKITRINRFYS